jgi:hypothetical protein
METLPRGTPSQWKEEILVSELWSRSVVMKHHETTTEDQSKIEILEGEGERRRKFKMTRTSTGASKSHSSLA